jgi:hypothetical protein
VVIARKLIDDESGSANLSISPGVDTDPVLVDSVDRNNYRNPALFVEIHFKVFSGEVYIIGN